jgi:hypothetical protein
MFGGSVGPAFGSRAGSAAVASRQFEIVVIESVSDPSRITSWAVLNLGTNQPAPSPNSRTLLVSHIDVSGASSFVSIVKRPMLCASL